MKFNFLIAEIKVTISSNTIKIQNGNANEQLKENLLSFWNSIIG